MFVVIDASDQIKAGAGIFSRDIGIGQAPDLDHRSHYHVVSSEEVI
jgi:hypothetical protein